jgi:hypothetical protein
MSETDDPTLPRPPEDGEDSLADVLGGFPRHLTTRLIDEEGARVGARRRLGTWALAGALALFALALPQPRLFLEGALAGAPGGPAPGHAADLVGGALGGWLGAHLAHQVALVASALALALCLPAALSIAARTGAPRGQQLAAATVLLLAPAAWLGGTGDRIGAGYLLAQLLLLRAVWLGGPRGRRGALALWVAASLAWPALLWLLPAILMGTAERDVPVRARWRRALVAGATALLPVAAWHLLGPEGPHGLARQLGLAGPETGAPLWSAPLAWSASALAGLGLAVVGLAALVLVHRNESEERPPLWLLAWCAVPVVAACLGAGGLHELSPLVLLPVALLGALDLIARQDERPATLLAAGLALGQAGVLAAALLGLAATDPEASWRARARSSLEPTDLVITDSEVHRAELRRRWDLEALLPGEAAAAAASRAHAAGRRVVLDLTAGSAEPELPAGVRPVRLDGPPTGGQ